MPAISVSKVQWENKKYPRGHPKRVVKLHVEALVILERKVLIIPKNKKYSLYKIKLSDCDILE